MDPARKVVGIEYLPIYVVATEADAWSVSERDYVDGVPLTEVVEGLAPDQHVYLVHLDNPGPGLGVKLTQLA